MFTPLVRFDAVYNPLFHASRKRLVDYPGSPAS
jgi:glutathionyl-hydroquinone reductase